MEKKTNMGNSMDEEENERKLLADTSDDEVEVDQKVDDENEVLESDPGDESDQSKNNKNIETEDINNDSDEQGEAIEKEIHFIETALTQNPYDYEAHKLLIEKLHKMGELDRLRLARENMSSKYPLTSELWLSWLRDEMKLALTPEQKFSVIELCERAVTDYLSVEVWLEYLQFSIGLGTEKETTEKIRNLFERALTAAGLHVMKGALIWDAFREFENFIALMMDSIDSEKKNQINRIGKLYRRQLACPLFSMEKTYEEYEIWRCAEGCDCTEDEKIIKKSYQKALLELNVRTPFEKKLEYAQNKNEQLDIYITYLTHEKHFGDPGRVIILYERALADISLESILWIDYLQFVEKNIKIDDIIEKIYIRAIRNVPWCVKIWQNWIRFYEKKNTSLTEIQKLVENALAVGFSKADEYKNLWITYLEYLRRKFDYKSDNENKQLEIIRNTFNRAHDHLTTFGPEGDPTCEILQFWARFEAIHANNMKKARWLWADIMSQGHSESAASWLEYISLEKSYGDSKHIRKLFQKALIVVKDWPESIANAWLNFERDEGTLKQMEICELKTKERLIKVAEERKKSQLYSIKHDEISRNKKLGKRKGEDSGKWKDLGASTFKISKFEQSIKPAREVISKLQINTSHEIINHNIQSKIVPPPGYERVNKEKEESYNIHEVDDKITIFVSNLDYTSTEEEIRDALKSVGPITLLRMIKDYKGRSKGYCYVQLSSSKSVEEALKLDRTRINSRPMFISRCDPNKTSRGSVFKYKTELEKNKLFIKGLSPSTTKEQLENIFKIYGNLKDVRVVTYRNGHSKGLAYIDYEDENSATNALVATDGMTIEEKIISVAVSQPPQRKQFINNDNSFSIKSLGSSSTSRSTFGNPKTVLSLVPRAVKRNVNSIINYKISNNGVMQSKSNADFRNMFHNKT